MRVLKLVAFLLLALFGVALAANNYLITTNIITPDAVLVPDKGVSHTDATTGATLTRRSDISELGTATDGMIVYSRYSPSNSNGQYLLVHGTNSTSCYVYRLSDNVRVADLKRDATNQIGEVNEVRWDYSGSHPNRVYFINEMSFYYMDVIEGNGSPALIRNFSSDFPMGTKIMNDVEGDSSNDSRYWAWMVKGATVIDGKTMPDRFIVYDKQTNTITGQYIPADNPNYTTYLPLPNMVEISPEGSKVILHYGTASDHPFTLSGGWADEGNGVYSTNYKAYTAGNSVFAYIKVDGTAMTKMSTGAGTPANITGNNQFAYNSTLDKMYIRFDGSNLTDHVATGNWGSRPQDDNTVLDGPHAFDLDFTNPVKVAISESHSGWGYSSTGKELFISQDNTRDRFQACYIDGTGGAYPNNCFDFFNHANWNYAGVHFSKFYSSNKRGWVLASTYRTSNDTWGANQILMMELKPVEDNPRVWRVSPSYNQYAGNYRDEASAALSVDGEHVYVSYNWMNAALGHGEAYEVDITGWADNFGGPAPFIGGATLSKAGSAEIHRGGGATLIRVQ